MSNSQAQRRVGYSTILCARILHSIFETRCAKLCEKFDESTNPRIRESTNPRILFDEARFNNQLTDTHSDVRWSNLFAGLIKREYNHAANQTLTSFVDIAAIERFEMAYRVSPVFCDINVTDTVGCAKPSFCIRRVDKSRCQSCRFLVSASRIEFA